MHPGLTYGGNAIYAALTFSCITRLQSVLNAAAWPMGGIPGFGHINSFVWEELHCLPLQKRIEFKISKSMHNSLQGCTASYHREPPVPVSYKRGL